MICGMITVSETLVFIRSTAFWTEAERREFITWIAQNPLAGDLIVGSSGLRKVRWGRQGVGKSGGTRVITYHVSQEFRIWLLIGYTKAKFDNLPTDFLVELRKEIENAS
jgi:hypothetical protein